MEWLRTLQLCPRPVAGRQHTAQDPAESANDGPHGRHVNPRSGSDRVDTVSGT